MSRSRWSGPLALLASLLLLLLVHAPAAAQDVEGPGGGVAPAASTTPTAAAPAGGSDGAISLAELKEGKIQSTIGQRLQSLLGLLAALGGCWFFSRHRQSVSWRLVAWGMGLQLGLGFLIMVDFPGLGKPLLRPLFEWVNEGFNAIMGCTTDGAGFLFGDLAKGNFMQVGTAAHPFDSEGFQPIGGQYARVGAYFAFAVLPTIIFFSSFMAVLYHLGVMQFVVKYIAVVMQKTMGTSGSETLSASGNIFVGQTEAPLLVRPFIPTMTESELMAIMTGGFATVAGGVMAAYVGFLNNFFPDIAGHLLSASVMSAPAGLVCAKLLVPEPDPTKSETYGTLKVDLPKVDANVIDAAARGAGDGLKLAANVGAMLLAFLALIALLNKVLGLACSPFTATPVTMELIMGWLCAPIAWLMGVPWSDCDQIGQLVGVKTIANEFVAYFNLKGMLGQGALEHSRSTVIAIYALCGFANLGSIAIQIGGIAGIAPERRSDLAKLGLRAMIAGNLACFMTACVAGLLI